MKNSRLTHAVHSGQIVLPETGKIVVYRAAGDADLSALPKERVEIIQGFFPDYDALTKRGFKVSVAASGTAALAIVCLPRSKAEALALIADAATRADTVIVDGQKTDGIDSIFKACRKLTAVSPAYSKAHGKTFWFAKTDALSGWAASSEPREIAPGFQTVAGVFSADKIDRGSVLLADALPEKLPKTIVDLGAGWGWLSAQILKNERVSKLHMVEAESSALDCARKNLNDERAVFHWDDARSFALPDKVEAVIMNPPFHTTRTADPDLGKAFIASAARLLKSTGILYMVANRHLPYETHLAEHFRNIDEIAGDNSFKVLRASGPGRVGR